MRIHYKGQTLNLDKVSVFEYVSIEQAIVFTMWDVSAKRYCEESEAKEILEWIENMIGSFYFKD